MKILLVISLTSLIVIFLMILLNSASYKDKLNNVSKTISNLNNNDKN